MKTCKELRDQIIFYDDLSHAEKQKLDAHIACCSQCQVEFRRHQAIVAGLQEMKEPKHTEDALLSRYATYLEAPGEPDFDGRRLTSAEVQKMEAHVGECSQCREKLAVMRSELHELSTYLETTDLPDVELGSMPLIEVARQKAAAFGRLAARIFQDVVVQPRPRYILIPATGLAILLLLVLINPFGKNLPAGYGELSALDPVQINYLTRGAGSSDLHSGVAAFNEGDYARAAQLLETVIANEADPGTREYARYVCGLAYVFAAQKDPAGASTALASGLSYLQMVIQQSSSVHIKENALWYAGKAALLQNNPTAARNFFEEVRRLNGRRSQQAGQILQQLENRLISSK